VAIFGGSVTRDWGGGSEFESWRIAVNGLRGHISPAVRVRVTTATVACVVFIVWGVVILGEPAGFASPCRGHFNTTLKSLTAPITRGVVCLGPTRTCAKARITFARRSGFNFVCVILAEFQSLIHVLDLSLRFRDPLFDGIRVAINGSNVINTIDLGADS